MRRFLRYLLVYFIYSVRVLLFKKKIRSFIYDIQHFFYWYSLQKTGQSPVDLQIPWLPFAAIDFLKKWLHKEMVVFEYGSGGSSLFFASRVKQLYSVEHDAAWFAAVQKTIGKKNIRNLSYTLMSPEPVSPILNDCGNPDLYRSCMKEYKDFSFEKYVKSIDQYPDLFFDMVIVDGRARPSCIKHALPKIKRKGILLLDNANRSYYLQPFPDLMDELQWKKIVFEGHFPVSPASVLNTTMIFIKQ